MKLKRDSHGHVVVEDGKPVYVQADGKEITFDPVALRKAQKDTELKAAAEVNAWKKAAIGGWFAGSKYIAEKLKVAPEIMASFYEKNFQYDGQKLIGRDDAGNIIYGRAAGPLVPAEFDEALEILVGRHPERAKLLREGAAPAGDGGKAAQDRHEGARGPGGKIMKRAAFDKLDAGAKSAHIKAGGRLVD